MLVRRSVSSRRYRVHTSHQPSRSFLFQSYNILIRSVNKYNFFNRKRPYQFHVFFRNMPYSSKCYRNNLKVIGTIADHGNISPVPSVAFRHTDIIQPVEGNSLITIHPESIPNLLVFIGHVLSRERRLPVCILVVPQHPVPVIPFLKSLQRIQKHRNFIPLKTPLLLPVFIGILQRMFVI